MKSRFLRRAGALLLALTLACSLLALPAAADDPADPGGSPVAVARVDLNKNSLALERGGSETLTATVTPPDAANLEIFWESSDETVATVSDSGLVTAVGPGSATITAAAEDSTHNAADSCTVTVTVPAVSITLLNSRLTMTVGEYEDLPGYLISPADTTDRVSWSSGDSTIVEIVGGRLHAVGQGTTTVTPKAGNASTESCTVTVNAALVTGITVTPNAASVPAGGSIDLRAEIQPDNVPDKSIRWTSTNPSITVSNSAGSAATVSVPSSVPAGTTFNVVATSVANKAVSSFCTIRVADPQLPEVKSVQITSPDTELFKYVDPGKSMTLAALAFPADAPEADRRITWSSDAPSIARVNPVTGEITGVAPGKATITAQAGGSGGPTAVREIEVSGILLSYLQRPVGGGQGTTVQLTEDKVVDIFQYRDISVTVQSFGTAKGKTVNWESSNNTLAQVINGRVTGNYPGDNVTITASVAGTGFTARFKVKVSEDVADAITVSMGSNPSYSFAGVLGTLNSRSQSKVGAPLDNVYNLKVSTKNGVLYYQYSSPDAPGHGVGGTERYYYQAASHGQMALQDVSFVPLPGFDGTAVVDYNAVGTNGTSFTGTIRIEATATGDISYSTAADRPVTFSAEHFSSVCKGRTGRAVGYVTFSQPSASRGTLHYNYSAPGQFSPKVDGSTRYYVSSSPYLDRVTFVPAEGFVGDVDIPYRCVDSAGAAYTGTVTVTVRGADGSQGGDVEYSTGLNQRQTLSAGDFNDACQRVTGRNLDYIRFESLPGSSAGILYLNYTGSSSSRAVTGRNYYRSSTPRISNLSFVPARGYSGTVTIPFTGTSTSGGTFSGNLIIHVDDDLGTVHYNTPRSRAVTFDASDFNDASRRITGETLSYVRFTGLPSSGSGVLYYNYFGSASTGSKVSTGTDYRRSGSPSLSSVSFVPSANYTGTVSIPFTGYGDAGTRFNGTVTVTVGDASSRIISYSTTANGSVRFSASDFNDACRAATGDSLDYVRFELPSSRYGALYHQYNTSSRTGNSVSSGTGYYRSGGSRLLGDVSFAAASSTGTVTFGYTGYSTRGDSFSGTVEITISGSNTVSTSVRYTGSSAPILFRSSDFQNVCQAALGSTLSSVQFNTLPGVGRLYLGYSSPGRTGSGVSTGTRYSLQDLNQISYLPKAEYQGTITIPFTAYDAQGASHSSTVEIQLSNSYCSASFLDTASGWDWAKPSIEFLRQSGITNGYSNNTFRPGQPISRGEFTLMICRAFQFSTGGSSGFPDVPANSSYAGAVAAARDLGIVQGNNGRFQPDRPITRQSAMTMICRALDAAGQSVPTADAGLLSSYADGGQVSSFARSSVAALVQMGAVRGNAGQRLNPTAAISRAEMAVILHRVLTR